MCQCTRKRAPSLAGRMGIEGLYVTVATAVVALAFAALTARAGHASALVREHVAWALARHAAK